MVFEHNETEKLIEIEIIEKEGEDRDDVFVVQLLQPDPVTGSKLSKKNQIFVEIVSELDVV